MRFWISMLLVVIIDQISKWLVISNLEFGNSIPLIKGIISLTYVQNQGAAFGLFAGNTWIFIVSAVLAVLVISVYNYRNPLPYNIQIILGLITGGAIGNLIDRFRYQYVIDFFDLGWWPVFNVADMAIVCGGILLIIYTFKSEEQDKADV